MLLSALRQALIVSCYTRDMTPKQIFKTHFKTKAAVGLFIILIAAFIRYFNGHPTTFGEASLFIAIIFVCVILIGLIDYYFYEKTAPKIKAKLLDTSPLLEFQNISFAIQDGNQINGQINDYNVTIAPLTTADGNNYLTIYIALALREGLDNYFKRFDDFFNLAISNEVLFAKAVIKNYDKEYDFSKLLNIVEETTLNLRDKNIEPLEIIDGEYNS